MPRGALSTLQPNAGNGALVGAVGERLLKHKTLHKPSIASVDINSKSGLIDENADSKLKLKAKDVLDCAPKPLTKSVACGPDTKTEPAESVSCGTQTEVSLILDTALSDTDTKKMLMAVEPNGQYWKLMAEQRELALKETIKENLVLSQQLATLNERNRLLQILADDGQDYANILQACMQMPDSVENENEEQSQN